PARLQPGGEHLTDEDADLDAFVPRLPGEVAVERARDGDVEGARQIRVLVDGRGRPAALLAHVAELRLDLLLQLDEGFGAGRTLGRAVLELGGACEKDVALGIVGDEDAIVRHRRKDSNFFSNTRGRDLAGATKCKNSPTMDLECQGRWARAIASSKRSTKTGGDDGGNRSCQTGAADAR